jgi:hypothetical protein
MSETGMFRLGADWISTYLFRRGCAQKVAKSDPICRRAGHISERTRIQAQAHYEVFMKSADFLGK